MARSLAAWERSAVRVDRSNRRKESGLELANLTEQHEVVLHLPDGSTLVLASSALPPARVQVERKAVERPDLPVPVFVEREMRTIGVPPPRPGVMWVVSRRVLLAHPGRLDLASPADLVRDSDGRVVGCRALSVNPGREPTAPG